MIALLGAVAAIAIVTAYVATRQARAARAVLRAGGRDPGGSAALATMDADSRLAGDVAHELNDLLTVITGHAELLIANLEHSGMNVQDADEIRRAALRAGQLTRPLRVLSGGHRPPADVIDVKAVAVRTTAALQHMLGPNIAVNLSLDDGITRARIAEYELEELLLKIGLHARDAMPRGGSLSVTIAMHHERGAAPSVPAEYVRMVVADTGTAIPATALAMLFEPQFVDDAGGGHSPTGLANVAAIVNHAGGRIQVESALAVGTTFTIDLPATTEPATASNGTRHDAHLPALVLVVEDEPGVRELIKVILMRAGHAIVTVAGPRAALAELKQQPAIAMMLVDIVMPEMDGYELVAEARKILPAVKVLFISAFAPDPARHPAGDGFLAKPFTSESLTGRVAKALSSSAP
ncbi:MAG: response regulator [Vicinamibacterales bacterium]